VVVSFCNTSDPALLKNTIEKHSYIPVRMGGQHRPVVECNSHNWCSVGVTTSFPHHSFVYTLYIALLFLPKTLLRPSGRRFSKGIPPNPLKSTAVFISSGSKMQFSTLVRGFLSRRLNAPLVEQLKDKHISLLAKELQLAAGHKVSISMLGGRTSK